MSTRLMKLLCLAAVKGLGLDPQPLQPQKLAYSSAAPAEGIKL